MKTSPRKIVAASVLTTMLMCGSAVHAATLQDDIYVNCYAAFQYGRPNFNHVNINQVPMLKFKKGETWPNNGEMRLAESLKQAMIEKLGSSAINRASCTSYIFESRALNQREPNSINIDWPFDPLKELSRFIDADYPGRAKPTVVSRPSEPLKSAKTDAQSDAPAPLEATPKYVEVLDGKGGTIRLSPGVAARNAAAAADYERRLAEHQRKVEELELANREVARIKAEQEAKAAAVMEAFRRQSEAHAELMRKHQQDSADYQAKLAGSAGVAENLGLRKFQATSPIRATREEAMRALSAPNGQKLTDIQCGEIKGFANEWTCWGFYVQETTRSGVSKQ